MYEPASLVVGDVLLMTSSPVWHGAGSALDAVIQWATVDPYDHAALVVSQPGGALVLAEALLHVQYSPLDKYVGTGHVFHVPTTVAQRNSLSQAAASKIGQFYGWEMLLQDGARDILHVDWSPRLNPHQLDCSAFVAWCFLRAGIRLTYKPAPAPADLAFSPIPEGPRIWRAGQSGQ